MIAYTDYRFDGRVRLEAGSLVEWGYEVTFLVPREAAQAKTYTLEGVIVKELSVDKYDGKNKLVYVYSYLMFLILAAIECTRLFFHSGVRAIHVHNMPDILVFAAAVPRLFGCKVVLDLHDAVPEMYQAKFEKSSGLVVWLLRWEERICCALAHRVICVNHVQKDIVSARGVPAGKIATVITMPKFVPPTRTRQERTQDSAFRMVNHGTISKRLGNDLILGAAAQLINKIPNFELHFVGAGDNLEQVLTLSRSMGLEGHVHFHERVPWNQLSEKLSTMDAGIVANRITAATDLMLPSKLIDYVVLGIPAIVPRLKAIEYYFSPDMVSFFEAEDIDSMVAATMRLYEDKDRRRQQPINAKKFWFENQWDGPKSGLRNLYAELFQERGRSGMKLEAMKVDTNARAATATGVPSERETHTSVQ